LENDEKWNVQLNESQKVVVFNENILFFIFLTSMTHKDILVSNNVGKKM